MLFRRLRYLLSASIFILCFIYILFSYSDNLFNLSYTTKLNKSSGILNENKLKSDKVQLKDELSKQSNQNQDGHALPGLSVDNNKQGVIEDEPLTTIQDDLDQNKLNTISQPITNNNQSRVGSVEEAMRYSVFASMSYCEIPKILNWKCRSCLNEKQFKLFSTHHNKRWNTFGLISVDGVSKKVVLSFRGSFNFKNFLLDARFRKRKYNIKDDNYDKKLLKKIKVHSGMLSSTDSIIFDMLKQLKHKFGEELLNYEFILVGHSLGGAMASLASIRLQNNIKGLNYDQIKVYTYGQPRVGNKHFVQYFNSLPITVLRTVQYQDFVTNLPFNKMGYYHHHYEYFIHPTNGRRLCLPAANNINTTNNKKTKNSFMFEHLECAKKYGYKVNFNIHRTYFDKSIVCDGLYVK